MKNLQALVILLIIVSEIISTLNDGWGAGSSGGNNAFFDFIRNALPITDHLC